MDRVRIVDSHTGGEPTRVVVASPIQLSATTMQDRASQFARDFDHYRRAIVCEPRGSDIIVGALLCPPVNSTSIAGVIFFNNVGNLGMCGHGLMGVAVVLKFLGRIRLGRYSVDTPVGTVHFEMLDEHLVKIENVTSFRWKGRQPITLFPGTNQSRTVHGDVAWGGNWFFICDDHGLQVDIQNLAELNRIASEIRYQMDLQKITARDGQLIDHVELIGPANSERADAKNFVLCPGGAYDRSPCGTGTSAKLACLAADGKLLPGQVHRQESIVGSVFTGTFQWASDAQSSEPSIMPTLIGSAYVNSQADLLLDCKDPFCWGLIPQ